MSFAVIQGCSKGLGRAITQALLRHTNLHVVGTTSSGANSARSSILSGLHGSHSTQHPLNGDADAKSSKGENATEESEVTYEHRLTTLAMDVRDESAVEAASRDIQGRFGEGSLKLLVNVSGVLHAEKNLASVNLAHASESFQINTFGHLLVYKHFLPLVGKRRDQKNNDADVRDLTDGMIPHGRSVMASVTARVGSIGDNHRGGWYSYRASKAATNQIVRTLSHELRLHNVPAVAFAYHPGTVKTDLSKPYVGSKKSNESEGLLEPDEAAMKFLSVVRGLKEEDSGGFLDWKGEKVEW